MTRDYKGKNNFGTRKPNKVLCDYKLKSLAIKNVKWRSGSPIKSAIGGSNKN